jgi:hypothetical protein
VVLPNKRSHQLYVPNQAAVSRGHQRNRQHVRQQASLEGWFIAERCSCI